MTCTLATRVKDALIKALVAVAGRRGLPYRLREDSLLIAAFLILRQQPCDDRAT